jgi:hypothetical protein
MIQVKPANTPDEAFAEAQRILKEAAVDTVHGSLTIEVRLKDGKPVQTTTNLAIQGRPQ